MKRFLFFPIIYLYICISTGTWTLISFHKAIICTISIYFWGSMVPDWVPFLSWLLILLDSVPIVILVVHSSGSLCLMFILYWAPPLKSTIFQRTLTPFSGECAWQFQICAQFAEVVPGYPKTLYKHCFHHFTSMKLAGPFYYKTHGSLFFRTSTSVLVLSPSRRRFYLPVVISGNTSSSAIN